MRGKILSWLSIGLAVADILVILAQPGWSWLEVAVVDVLASVGLAGIWLADEAGGGLLLLLGAILGAPAGRHSDPAFAVRLGGWAVLVGLLLHGMMMMP